MPGVLIGGSLLMALFLAGLGQGMMGKINAVKNSGRFIKETLPLS